MNRRVFGALCASVFAVPVLPAAAQESPALPKVLKIYREEIKQGKAAAHEKSESSWVKALGKYKSPIYAIGCDTIAGQSEAWFFEAHDSFKSIENAMAFVSSKPEFNTLDAVDGELRSNGSVMVAALREDLSYHTTHFAQELPKTRYFAISIVRIRPYTDMRLAELGKQAVAATEKANSDVPVATYQIVTGGPQGMYLLITPMKSLDVMDQAPERARALMTAMGTDKAMSFYKSSGEVITGAQMVLLAVNPKMSYVSKEFAAQDADFWMPKPPAAAKPVAAKSASGAAN